MAIDFAFSVGLTSAAAPTLKDTVSLLTHRHPTTTRYNTLHTITSCTTTVVSRYGKPSAFSIKCLSHCKLLSLLAKRKQKGLEMYCKFSIGSNLNRHTPMINSKYSFQASSRVMEEHQTIHALTTRSEFTFKIFRNYTNSLHRSSSGTIIR